MAVPAGHPEKPEGYSGRLMLTRMNMGAHEELANWGLSHISAEPGSWMLDIGCGGGANLARLHAMVKNPHVFGIDYSPLAVEMSREVNKIAIDRGTCGVVEGSVEKMPFTSHTFDVATAFETVYFWPNIEASLKEVHRVLKPGATFLICNEANGQTDDANEIAQEIDIMSIYTAQDFEVLLKAAQFSVVEIDDEGQTGRICVVAQA